MSDEHIDDLETRLRSAAGLQKVTEDRSPQESRSFLVLLGCSARVQLDHIDGRPIGGITVTLRGMTADAAEALLRFLATRNEPNGSHGYSR